MSLAGGTEICRVTVVGPHKRVDLALPGHVPFAELLPAVTRYAGLERSAAPEAPDGWLLQRLGQAPFAMEATPAQAGLRDGELIYLSPHRSPLPELAFDDVADVIATGVEGLPRRWAPADAQRSAVGAGVVALLAGVTALALAGPPWTLPAGAAGAMAVLLLAGAAAASRAAGSAIVASALGWAALPYAFLAGLLGPAGGTPLTHLGALQLISGLAAALLAATLAAVGIAQGTAVFSGAAGAALLGGIGAALDYALGHVTPVGAAAVTAAVALAVTPLIPAAAFRVAGLSLPPVPRDAEELRRDTLTVEGTQVLERTAAADRVVTGAVSGIGMVAAVAAAALAFAHGWLPTLTALVLSGALLLRARVFRGRGQRLWLLAPGYGGLALLAVGACLTATQATIVTVVLPLLAAGAGLAIVAGAWAPGRRMSPLWGRAAEIVDMTLVIGLLPLALAVTGVFGFLRGLSG